MSNVWIENFVPFVYKSTKIKLFFVTLWLNYKFYTFIRIQNRKNIMNIVKYVGIGIGAIVAISIVGWAVMFLFKIAFSMLKMGIFVVVVGAIIYAVMKFFSSKSTKEY